MKSGKLKKLGKRIGWVLIIMFVFMIGVAIGEESSDSHVERVVYVDRQDEIVRDIEQQIIRQEQIVEESVENVVVEIPEIPEISAIHVSPPEMPVVHHVNHGPSFFQVVSGIANFLVAIFLIGIGVKVLVKQRQQPVEKQPK